MLLPPTRVFDCVGIGIGPANLSLACLLSPFKELTLRVLDQRGHFAWHEGLLLPDASVQVPFIKDLVSLVDPTNRYSFLAFLGKQKRMYQFFNSRFSTVRRTEFNQYLQWVCRNLDSLEFSRKVVNAYRDDQLVIETTQGTYRTTDIVLGIGRVASIPDCARGKMSPTLFHSSEYLFASPVLKGKRIAVIGGGQSGAEIFLDIISNPSDAAPRHCSWVSRRSNFFPIDDSPFTNEFFSPSYAEHFYRLSPAVRRQRLDEQKLASDGISAETLTQIYQAIYDLKYLRRSKMEVGLHPGCELLGLHHRGHEWEAAIRSTSTGRNEVLQADVVILATGYRYELPSWLDPIAADIEMDGEEAALNDDFTVKWKTAVPNRIYMQNAGRSQWGIADPNLSLIAWRSAKIINSLLGRRVYDVEDEPSPIDWCLDVDPVVGRAFA